jgi:pimeloyl-ACP methyl ester carboxylesterase
MVHFKDREIKILTHDGYELAGILSQPTANNLNCSVLMLTGSGKTDGDETVPADMTFSGRKEKLFKQISDSLTSQGVTTLRYSKRGVLDASGNVDSRIWKTADRDNLINDSIRALDFLIQQTGHKNILVLGHSEGTILAVELAHLNVSRVSGLLMLGAQARSMKEMLHYQIVESRIKSRSGIGEEGSSEAEYRKALEMIKSSNDELAPDGKPIKWYRQHLSAPSNASRLGGLMTKTAIFQGEIDPQTPIQEIDIFTKYRSDLEIFKYPDLGHGFSPDREGRPTLGPIDNKVLDDLKKVVKTYCGA